MSTARIRELESELRRLRKQLRKGKAERLGIVIRKGRGCRDRDEDLKAERGYTDPSSFVRRDGSEKLVGLDWKRRVFELGLRSGMRCEFVTPIDIGEYERCGNVARDADHKIKRSTRRDDQLSNLQHLCAMHHDEKHQEFKTRFTKRGRAGDS